MTKPNLSTEPYKGVRDFYPEDMAIQQYIFDTWSSAAESFGFKRYDASVLEPADMYKSKGAVNEEIVNDQTYTFTDRGDREVTLRPEMTPTVARMIAGKHRELAFPARWYSIPNLFRYERAQRGRLREHWQLNCDIFGSDEVAADVETIALGYHIMHSFGADPSTFEIRLNDRVWMNARFAEEGFTHEQSNAMLYLLDRKEKIDNFDEEAEKIAGRPFDLGLSDPAPDSRLAQVKAALEAMGITNTRISISTVRGFDYYTGAIFEFFDTSGENNRSLLGGGRYDDLASMYGAEGISGVGFGMGDVTMRDFLETHNLLPDLKAQAGPDLVVIPMTETENLEAEKIAAQFRTQTKAAVVVDFGTKKVGDKIARAAETNAKFVLVVGSDELSSGTFTLKNVATREEQTGSLEELQSILTQ